MADIVVNGNTSGAVTLSAPAVAGTVTVTLPSTSGTMAVGGGTITTLTTTSDITVQGVTVGRGAGAVATNTAVGASALAANQAGGTNNTAIGNATLDANTTGDANTAVGDDALGANTTASNNTAVGYQAGYTNVTGALNTFIGVQAGYFATGGNNSYLGHGSGSAVTTGTKNTIIGRYDGNQGGLDIRTASNHIVLSDGDGNPRGYFNNNGDFYPLTRINLPGAVSTSGQINFFNASSSTTLVTFPLATNTISLNGSTGNLTFASDTGGIGDVLNISTNGVTAIKFAATQVASANANTLDDYEEGTYTATLTCGTSGTITLSTTIDTLSYIKIGKQVTLFGRINIASVSSPTGTIDFSLPFAADNTLTEESDFYALTNFTHGVNIGATTVSLFSEINPSNNTVARVFEMIDASSWSALPASNLLGNGNEYFYFTGSYRASS